MPVETSTKQPPFKGKESTLNQTCTPQEFCWWMINLDVAQKVNPKKVGYGGLNRDH